ncbi:putative adenylate kinase 1 [Heracleum sosnowskyi]|uniref:Adenylate kinase 1 n=1 Tax=Heracleum sosnowskyi TaxID=360622 RepID=A0AAD8IGC7_9APIA|nr:putative adenylate kinase 1 [Heracleum sosnowskyi]
MGSCVSSHKRKNSDMKLHKSISSKSDQLIFSPVKPIGDLGSKLQPDPSTNFPDLGSEEEAFFDSQAWLDSDCDDDFMSVNGEFTPSRGNTPVHSFITAAPQVNKAFFEDSALGGTIKNQAFPCDKKMSLSDLFNQSFRAKQDAADEQNTSGCSSDTNCSSSLQSSERTPNGNFKAEREKSLMSLQCCLPNLGKQVTLLKETR